MCNFNTKKEAIDYLKSLDMTLTNDRRSSYEGRSPYVLEHNEIERPNYTPGRYRSGWGITEHRHTTNSEHIKRRVDIYKSDPMAWTEFEVYDHEED